MNIPTAEEAYYSSVFKRGKNQEAEVSSAITSAIEHGYMFCEYWSKSDPTEVVEKLKELGYTVDIEKWQPHHDTIHVNNHSLLVIYWSNT